MGSSSELQVDLRQMIYAIESAVSLVGMNDTNHGKRVGYIASQLAHQLGYNNQMIQFFFELGLLHDCGVSTEQIHNELVNHFDWHDAYIHCEIGYRLLKAFKPLERFATAIRYHHTPWEKLKKLEISSQEAHMANLIFLSDRIDNMAACHYEKDILLAREEIVHVIKSYSGTYFDPVSVNAFLEREKSEAFWISLRERHIILFTCNSSDTYVNIMLSNNSSHPASNKSGTSAATISFPSFSQIEKTLKSSCFIIGWVISSNLCLNSLLTHISLEILPRFKVLSSFK